MFLCLKPLMTFVFIYFCSVKFVLKVDCEKGLVFQYKNMTDQFSDKTIHQSEFQHSNDRKFLNVSEPLSGFQAFRFSQVNTGNSRDYSMENIPTSSRLQLPPPSLPPPQLSATNSNIGRRFPSENYTRPPPPSILRPITPQSYSVPYHSLTTRPNLQILDFSKPPPILYPPPPPQPPNLIGHNERKQQHPIVWRVPPPNAVSSTTEDPPLKRSSGIQADDEFWVQNFISNVRKRLQTEETQRKIKEIKISDVQEKLLTYASLVKELKQLTSNILILSSNPDFIQKQQWEETPVHKALKLKVQIEELRDFFSEEENIKRIKEALEKRREKRIKRRKTKKDRSERRRKRKEEWKRMEEEMDSEIRRANEEEKQKLEEEKLKKEADSVLREVRSKQEDVARMGKILNSLMALREIRKKKGEMHGYVEDPEQSVFFQKMKVGLEEILSEQQKIYEAEEHTLKIMIEESQSSSILSKKPRPQVVPNLKEVKKDIYQIYFGKERERSEAEKKYERSFLAAEESAEILVQRRKDWDQFIVGESSFGSSVPLGWVLPNVNPNSDWMSCQESS